MATKIKDAGYTLSPTVERALRSVEGHTFVPDATLAEAYENDIVVTKRGVDDQVLSSLSQPSIVAFQLGQLGVQPGHRVLEIGADVGYNATLLAHLVDQTDMSRRSMSTRTSLTRAASGWPLPEPATC
jgi:protein-L-isoaspartate(D-aspartate) O-methyltransferase